MERNRIIPRLRPRPHDLRRKVLLKNFFREQMTYIPIIRTTAETSSDVNSDSDFDQSESNLNANEGNVLTPKKVEDNIVKQVPIPEPAPSTSNCSEKENSNNSENSSIVEDTLKMSEKEEKPSVKFSRFTRIIETIDSRLSSRKNRRKGITKAKHDLRSSKGILKPAGRKISKDGDSSTKIKAKSFFERFKSRRDKKRNKISTPKLTNLFSSRNPSPIKCDTKVTTTSTQSVQTDASWSPDHYEKMEQSNRSLREENRLLSESLSSIITNAEFRSGSIQNSLCTDSYTNCSNNSVAYTSSEQRPPPRTSSNGHNSLPSDFSRTRILRSKSVQSRSEKRNIGPSRHRTRSFTSRYIKRPFGTDSFSSNEPYNCEQEYHRGDSIASPASSRVKTRPSILRSIDISPFSNANSSSVLKTLPGKSSKAIVRRSSMPEKSYNWSYNARPLRSSSMRENNRYSYKPERMTSHHNKSSLRRRSSTNNGYSCPVPFQDLPAEAFY